MPRKGRVRVVASAADVAIAVPKTVANSATSSETIAAFWMSSLAKALHYQSSQNSVQRVTDRLALNEKTTNTAIGA